MNIPFRKVAVPVLALLIAQPSSGGELLGYGEAVELAANASPGVVAQKHPLTRPEPASARQEDCLIHGWYWASTTCPSTVRTNSASMLIS